MAGLADEEKVEVERVRAAGEQRLSAAVYRPAASNSKASSQFSGKRHGFVAGEARESERTRRVAASASTFLEARRE